MMRIISALLAGVVMLAPGMAAAADPVRLADNAPDSYTVTAGDTLWGISARFLQDPWRWPDVWKLNKDEIRNPHLIYPGQLVVLDRSGPVPVLKLGRQLSQGGQGLPNRSLYEKRFPQVHSSNLEEALRTIPARIIEPFLSDSRIVNSEEEQGAGVIVSVQEGRVYSGPGDLIYALPINQEHRQWSVFREAKPLVEPVTGERLGYEATFVGTAQLTAPAGPEPEPQTFWQSLWNSKPRQEPATLQVLTAKAEIGLRDRLLPSSTPELISYAPHAPAQPVEGRVVSVHGGVAQAGRYSVVSIGLGARDNMEVGHVLAIHRSQKRLAKFDDGSRSTGNIAQPQQRTGLALVFRVFERASYALIMESSEVVNVADVVRNP